MAAYCSKKFCHNQNTLVKKQERDCVVKSPEPPPPNEYCWKWGPGAPDTSSNPTDFRHYHNTASPQCEETYFGANKWPACCYAFP